MLKKKKHLQPGEESEPKHSNVYNELIVDPSYTRFTIPYSVTCRERYQRAVTEYRRQLLEELDLMIETQNNAWNAERISKIFSKGVLRIDKKKLISVSPRQRDRIEFLLKNDLPRLGFSNQCNK